MENNEIELNIDTSNFQKWKALIHEAFILFPKVLHKEKAKNGNQIAVLFILSAIFAGIFIMYLGSILLGLLPILLLLILAMSWFENKIQIELRNVQEIKNLKLISNNNGVFYLAEKFINARLKTSENISYRANSETQINFDWNDFEKIFETKNSIHFYFKIIKENSLTENKIITLPKDLIETTQISLLRNIIKHNFKQYEYKKICVSDLKRTILGLSIIFLLVIYALINGTVNYLKRYPVYYRFTATFKAQKLHDYDNAIKDLNKSLILEKNGNYYARATCYYKIAEYEYELQNINKSLTNIEKSKKLFELANDEKFVKFSSQIEEKLKKLKNK